MSAAGPFRDGVAENVAAVAAMHLSRIGEGFLATLGEPFLRRLYRRIVRSPAAFVVVAGADPIVGFVAVAVDTRRLYREFLVRDGAIAAVQAAPAVLRSPRRVYETLRYGVSTPSGELPAAEILSIAVADGETGAGTGTGLVRRACDELGRRGIDGARVVTAVDNVAAVRMYERAGFSRVHQTHVHKGTPQELLVWH